MSTEMNVRSLLDMALAASTEGNSCFCFVVNVNRLFRLLRFFFVFLIVKIEQSITVPRRIFLPLSKSNRKFIKIVYHLTFEQDEEGEEKCIIIRIRD